MMSGKLSFTVPSKASSIRRPKRAYLVGEGYHLNPPFIYFMKIFFYSNSIFFFAIGLFSPFLILHIQEIAGLQWFGLALGITLTSQAITNIYIGRLSDKMERKSLLFFSSVSIGVIILLYTLVTSLWQLLLLQILYGITTATHQTNEMSLLGDITQKETRGSNIGRYNSIVTAATGIAMILGGYAVSLLGINIFFYIIACIVFISALILKKM